MSAAPSLSFSPLRRFAAPALCGLLLALALVRVPTAMDVDPESSHRALLYETIRLGRNWVESGLTTEGPLAALQTPAYLGGSIWMALAWQIAGNLLLAGILVAFAWRLPWPRRTWALAALAGILARWPELAPWLVIVLVGHDLIRAWDREPRAVLPAAGLLGFLALFSLGHLLLGLLALVLVASTARPPLAKGLASAGFVLGLAGGWLALGQPLAGLGAWLQRGLPLLAQTSASTRATDLAPYAMWAGVTALGFLVVLVRYHRHAPERSRSRAAVLFLAGAAWLAWKTIALQDHGTPLVFFGTVLLAGFVLWHYGSPTRWVAALALLALAGLARAHPEFLPNALGHFNRQMVFNWRQLSGGTQLRNALRTQVGALKAAHAWPKIRELVGSGSVGAAGDALPRALYNGLNLSFPTDVWTGPGAPDFVIEGLSASLTISPAFVGATAQQELYRHYELVTEENGYLLWRRRATGTPAPVQVATGTLRFGETLALPAAADTAYWLEVDVSPGLAGRLWSIFAEVPEPGVIARDTHRAAVRYLLPPAVAARGFLADPLIRGNVEFQRWQRGGQPARTAGITVTAPATAGWLWSGRWQYRLYALPGLKLNGDALRQPPGVAFRAFNRSPVGSAYTLPFVESPPAPDEALFFVHPSSALEFTVTAADRRIRGSFGIAPGAYDRAGKTDGVDFSIEYFGTDGSRQVLLHRHLDPAGETGDRGVPDFDVALPVPAEGRLLLRTYNPPYRSAAWDWAFWRNVVIE